ncbi:hypothetical protein ACFV2H_18615 [Streptomyces sp. NPDC059629]|uniref:hypothetical protein n=1 Tax=Streptomyces sp. NPDC059629 TaxID=3346889 RepID=UPI0036979607
MSESVPVHCPACRREHVYSAPSYPCACGAPVTPCLDDAAEPTPVAHRAWDEDWVTVSCGACGRRDQWPQPELGCPCGAVLRVPVAGTGSVPPSDPEPRPAFRPVTIRTARDAVTAAALYLRWLGYRDIRRAGERPPSGIGLAARGLVAHVDPTVRPASRRDVECLWLTAMTEDSGCVYFSLAGYAEDARECAEALGIPLFVLDLTGAPQAVNPLAGEMDAEGA